MIPLACLAWRRLYGPVRGSGWHRWAIRVSVFAATFVLIGTVATLAILLEQREASQAAIFSVDDQLGDVWFLPTDELRTQDDRSVRSFWVQPVGDDPSAIPFGLTELPAPGTAAVSPALAELIATDPVLSERIVIAQVIGRSGVESRDDLLAWVRPTEDRSIATAAYRVASFANEQPLGIGGYLVSSGSGARPYELVAGAFGLILVPILILLVATLNTSSMSRNRWLQILAALGTRRSTLVRMMLAEQFLLALPSIVLAGLAWQLIAVALDAVPFVDETVFPRQLVLSWWLLAATMAITLVIVVLATLIALRIASVTRPSPRPTSYTETLSLRRFGPVGFTIVSFIAYALYQTPFSGTLLLLGLAMTMVSAPAVAPSLLRPIGLALRGLPSLSARIASGALILQPVRRARPFLALSVLITLAFIGSGYVAFATVRPVLSNGPDIAAIRWADPSATDLQMLAASLPSSLVVPISTDDNRLTLGISCETLQNAVADIACSSNGANGETTTLARIGPGSSLTGISFGANTIHLTSPTALDSSGEAISIRADGYQEGNSLIAVALTLAGGSVVSPASTAVRDSPILPWLEDGLIIAFIMLGFAAFFPLVDNILTSSGARRHLLALGVLPRRLAAIEASLFAIPATIVSALGLLAGTAVYIVLVAISFEITFSWSLFFGLLLFTALTIVVGTLVVTLVSVRSTYRDD